MESNGKRVTRGGEKSSYATGRMSWGEPGTNGQHSFYQMIHQGTRLVPRFHRLAQAGAPRGRHHDVMMIANCCAQSRSARGGKPADEVCAEGTRPLARAASRFSRAIAASTILAERLTPGALGALVALYEHKVFAQSAIWDINSFDQWGVGLGKALAQAIIPELESATEPKLRHDSSTNNLIRRYRGLQGLRRA